MGCWRNCEYSKLHLTSLFEWHMLSCTQNFTYPKGVALPLGGPTDYPYLVLETHYNNPSSVAGA